jgi:hypothetical protein
LIWPFAFVHPPWASSFNLLCDGCIFGNPFRIIEPTGLCLFVQWVFFPLNLINIWFNHGMGSTHGRWLTCVESCCVQTASWWNYSL